MYTYSGDNMNKKETFYKILVIITLISLALLLVPKTFQNDTFYSIKIGKDVLINGIDMIDHYSFTNGLTYTYPHWLFDIMIYTSYYLGGYTGIYILTLCISLILLFTMYYVSSKLTNNKYVSFFVVIMSSFALRNFLVARAQIISFIMFLIIIYSIEMLRKTNKKKYYLYSFLSALVIANTHLAVWPFIFVLFMPYIVQDIIYLIKKKTKKEFLDDSKIIIEKSKLKETIICLLLLLLTGFMTPNFLVPYTYLIKTELGISTKYIDEHRAPLPKEIPYLYISFGLAFFTLLLKNIKIKLKDLFFIFGLALVALLSYRSIALYVILTSFCFSSLFANFFETRKLELKPIFNNKVFVTITIIVFASTLYFLIPYEYKKEYVAKKYPIFATEYIKENLDYENIRLYNDYEIGSYLLMNDIPVFIDSRADLYLEEFNTNCTIFKDFLDFNDEYKSIIKKYDITHLLLKKNSKVRKEIKDNKDYNIIYSDDDYSIYEVLTK